MPATSSWSFSVYQLPALLGLGITLVPLAYVIQRRRAPGAKWFLGLLGTVALWCLFDLVSVGARDRELVMTATRLLYIPTALLPVCFFMFAQRYARHRHWGRRGGLAALLVLHDITKRRRVEAALIETGESLRRANRELEQLASRDALTGLPNRRVFMERLAGELKRFRRQGQPLALALVDLDHFKLVNDNHGHLAGDRVLVETAAVLQSSVRETDLAGRLGGEEFGLLMPGTDLAGAREVAERVRWHLAAPAERFEGKPAPRVTASIGLTVVDPTDSEQTLESLLARADALLYRAKREGRDRICAD